MHIVFAHIPVAGSALCLIILLIGLAMGSETYKKLGFALSVLIGAAVLIAYMTGDGAKAEVEVLPGIPLDLMNAHANSATKVALAGVVLIALSGFNLLAAAKDDTKPTNVLLSVAALVLTLFFSIGQVQEGLKISHAQFRGATAGDITHDGNDASPFDSQ